MDKLISLQAAIKAVEFGITYAKAIDTKTGEVRELFKQSNEELRKAVERIKALPSIHPDTTNHDSIPAKTGKNGGDGTSSDCISRQQAIDELNDEYHGTISDESMKIYQIIKWLNELPSAQPDIIRCKDCKYYKYGICMKIGVNKSFYGFCDWAERGEQNE